MYLCVELVTLHSITFTATTSPSVAKFMFAATATSSFTLNTDLAAAVSRDGGTTWATTTLTTLANLEDSTTLYGDTAVNLASEPAGTSMQYRIITNNGRGFSIYGVALQWGTTTAQSAGTLSVTGALSANSLSLSSALGLVNGGTATTTFYNGGLVFSDGAKLTQAASAALIFWDNTNARLGLGTSTPWGLLSINPNGITGPSFVIGSSTQTNFIVTSAGNVGIGTTSPVHQLTTTGSVQFATFGAGTLTTDANGNLSVSSDERLKNIQGNFTRGLDDLLKLNPILYHWNALSGLEQISLYAGFSAQNVQSAIPEAVGTGSSGYLTLQDRPLIAAAVNAIKEIATITGTFKSNLISFLTTWLGSATNGIASFYAGIVHSSETDTQRLCTIKTDGTRVCVTNDQLAALLSAAPAATLANPSQPSATSGGTSSASPGTNLQGSTASSSTNLQDASTTNSATPPVIHINGNNPATIAVGSTYADLGAVITGPAADTNLGITVLVDNATSTGGTVTIDATTAGTHTIIYTVTNPAGLTGSATRTVIVSTPANDNSATSSLPVVPPPANDNPPATTTASTTATLTQ